MIWTHLAAALAAAAIAATGTWQVQNWRHGATIASMHQAQAQALQQAQADALATQQTLERERQKVEARYAQLKRTAASDAAAADHALRGLRDALADASATRPGAGASAPDRADGDPRNDIIGECAAAAAALAVHADRLAAQVIGLQDYVSRVLGGLASPPK